MKKIKYLEFIPIILITIGLYLMISNFSIILKVFKIITPVLWGFAISYLLNAPSKYFVKKFNIQWGYGVLISYIIAMIILALAMLLIFPAIINNVTELVSNLPDLVNKMGDILTTWQNKLNENKVFAQFLSKVNVTELINKFTNFIKDYIIIFSNQVFWIMNGLLKFIIGIVISVYLLLSKNKYVKTAKNTVEVAFMDNTVKKMYRILRKADFYFSKFLVGKIIDSAIIGAIAFVGFYLIGVPYYPLIALIIGITNIIPYFGPFIGAVPALLITALSNPTKSLIVLVFIFVLQQADGYFIGPKILGDHVGVSAIWIIIGVIIGGGLFGVIGMILGVPMIALINSEISDYVDNRVMIKKKNELTETFT